MSTAFNQSSAGEGNAEADDTVQIQDATGGAISGLEETAPASVLEPGTQQTQVRRVIRAGVAHRITG